MYQHPSDWHNNTGIIRQAKEQEMGVILMRPLTSGVFQRLMAEAFPEIGCGWDGAFSRGTPLPVLSATSVRCSNSEVRK